MLLRTIRKSIPFCSEKKIGKRECFYAHLGLCSPCPSVITTNEEKTKYQTNIRRIKNILQGKGSTVIRGLKKEMKELSTLEKFEDAAILRNKITGLERLFSGRLVLDDRITDASFMESIREKELQELEEVLHMSPIHRIECFDISNFQFKNAVASMVVSVDGIPVNGEYRRFKIKGRRIFDPEMLLEVLSRRMKHSEWPMPDLFVLDGGTPQLCMVYPQLKKLYPHLPRMIGIAKRPDRIIRADTLTELPLKRDSLSLHIIERLRDEAHRFAKKYHTLLRKNEVQYTL
ncbi:MAG: UvrB/UvrC motif-containing protein [Patescibacteria group bacterium]